MSNHAVMPLKDYVDVCEKIRERTGSIDVIKSREMANGVNEVYEAGKKAEYDKFWDDYQNYGKRTNYKHAFAGVGWGGRRFYPKYSMQPDNAQTMFVESSSYWATWDLVARLEECGVSIDFSKVIGSGFNNVFMNCMSTTIPFIDTTSANDTSLGYAFHTPYVTKIYGIKLKDSGTQTFPSTFNNATGLKDIIITGGVIGRSISFSASPLTIESMVSIITHLKNYAGTQEAGKYALTLKDSCKILMAEQGEIEELDGKTYDAYIADIGWNLA
ncbi:MAG: hypothetical protein IKB93_12320 [Clostridia bacterium]|nr:hypothetical protein [Clostridia bacterium]